MANGLSWKSRIGIDGETAIIGEVRTGLSCGKREGNGRWGWVVNCDMRQLSMLLLSLHRLSSSLPFSFQWFGPSTEEGSRIFLLSPLMQATSVHTLPILPILLILLSFLSSYPSYPSYPSCPTYPILSFLSYPILPILSFLSYPLFSFSSGMYSSITFNFFSLSRISFTYRDDRTILMPWQLPSWCSYICLGSQCWQSHNATL